MAARISSTVSKRKQMGALEQGTGGKAESSTRLIVCVTRCSIHTLDEDNLYGSVKGLIDSLRDSGLIANDDPESIELHVSQKKVRHRKEVGTLIEIIWPTIEQ